MKAKFTTLLINAVLLIILFFFITEGTGLIKWMNALFYITVFNMILFLYLFITKGKFFDGIVTSFRRLTKYDETNQRKLPSETVTSPTYELFKFNFGVLAASLAVLQFVYFLN